MEGSTRESHLAEHSVAYFTQGATRSARPVTSFSSLAIACMGAVIDGPARR